MRPDPGPDVDLDAPPASPHLRGSTRPDPRADADLDAARVRGSTRPDPRADADLDAPPASPRAEQTSARPLPEPPPEAPPQRTPTTSRTAIVREKELLGDLTRQLVQTMNRTSYYEVGHPAHYAERDELHARLMAVLADQPQVGYVLQRGDPPEILVDGLTQGRVRLSEVLQGGVYELFVPRFVEYFDRHDLVLLAFRAGITSDELGRFTSVLARPAAGKHRFDLSTELLRSDVWNVSVVLREELGDSDADLPWQIRVCLARLRRDLRAVPMFRDLGHEALRRAKRQIFADTVRPLQNAELLQQLVRYAPRIERDAERVEGLEDLRVIPTIVEVLAPRPLVELTRVLCERSGRTGGRWDASDEAEADGLRGAIELCARRLAKEDPPEAEPVLRLLVQHRILHLEDLPIGLQEWLRAEALYLVDEAGPLPPTPLLEPDDARVLAKVGRLALRHDRLDRLAEVAERLDEAAAGGDRAAETALTSLLLRKEIDDLGARLDGCTAREAEPCARVLAALGLRGALSLAERIASAGVNAHLGRGYHALERLPHGPAAVVSTLAMPGVEPAALRLLLTLAAARPSPEAAAAARSHAHHADPGVRVAALVAVLAGDPAAAAPLVERALEDRDASVLEVAMSALAERLGKPDRARARALAIVAGATADTPMADLEVALRLLQRCPGDGAERAQVVAAVRGLHEAERARVAFGVELRGERHPGLVASIERALAHLGDETEAAPASRRSFWDRLRGG